VSVSKIRGQKVVCKKTISDHHVRQILAPLKGLTEKESIGKSTFLQELDYFENNLLTFQGKSATMCWEIYSEGARPDYELKGGISRFNHEIK
jgi:hypothetical protein